MSNIPTFWGLWHQKCKNIFLQIKSDITIINQEKQLEMKAAVWKTHDGECLQYYVFAFRWLHLCRTI